MEFFDQNKLNLKGQNKNCNIASMFFSNHFIQNLSL